MASKYYGDLVFSTGEYEKDGETKKRWSKAGAVFRDDETGNMSVKLEAVPASPDWSGWMKIFKSDRDNQDGQTKPEAKSSAADEIDDSAISLSDIPF
jgi:hypothetical protein